MNLNYMYICILFVNIYPFTPLAVDKMNLIEKYGDLVLIFTHLLLWLWINMNLIKKYGDIVLIFSLIPLQLWINVNLAHVYREPVFIFLLGDLNAIVTEAGLEHYVIHVCDYS